MAEVCHTNARASKMPATGQWTFGLPQVVFGGRLAEGRSGRFFERTWRGRWANGTAARDDTGVWTPF
jgi:hypothetical protein